MCGRYVKVGLGKINKWCGFILASLCICKRTLCKSIATSCCSPCLKLQLKVWDMISALNVESAIYRLPLRCLLSLEFSQDNGCAAFCRFWNKSRYVRLCFLFYFRALASSAPIWQFPGMVPCGDFYKTVTQDFAKSGPNCDVNIRKSWKAIDNVTSTGKCERHDVFFSSTGSTW